MSTPRLQSGIELIAIERTEQTEKHGWSIEHDESHHNSGNLLDAAEAMRNLESVASHQFFDRWDGDIYFRLLKKSKIERLVVAGAWIAAEIDRLRFREKEINR